MGILKPLFCVYQNVFFDRNIILRLAFYNIVKFTNLKLILSCCFVFADVIKIPATSAHHQSLYAKIATALHQPITWSVLSGIHSDLSALLLEVFGVDSLFTPWCTEFTLYIFHNPLSCTAPFGMTSTDRKLMDRYQG